MGQWTRIGNPQRNLTRPQCQEHLTENLEKLNTYMQKNEMKPYLTTYTKIKSKWNKHLNAKLKLWTYPKIYGKEILHNSGQNEHSVAAIPEAQQQKKESTNEAVPG